MGNVALEKDKLWMASFPMDLQASADTGTLSAHAQAFPGEVYTISYREAVIPWSKESSCRTYWNRRSRKIPYGFAEEEEAAAFAEVFENVWDGSS